MELNEWKPIASAPEGVAVETRIDDGFVGPRNQTVLVRKANLWFFPDFRAYVYYSPTHWRHVV